MFDVDVFSETHYSVSEAAKRLGVTNWAVYGRIRNKTIPAVRFAGRWLIPRQPFDALLAERSRAGVSITDSPQSES